LSEMKKRNKIFPFPQRYWGIDISDVAIDIARRKHEDVSFEVMDATSMDYEDCFFDFVVSYGSMEHIYDVKKSLSEASRVLKLGGIFLIMLPSLDYYRNDRQDEGWYEDIGKNPQMQWNLKREQWERYFAAARLKLLDIGQSAKYGAKKPGVFFFGEKEG
jgi:ubiquinone/menaquinone biosynthesis C-methylase UbiE